MSIDSAQNADYSFQIKSLQLALLQTVQTFNPNPMLDPSGRPRSQIYKRKSADRLALLNQADDVDMDFDACQTSTQQRKLSEEVLESDFASSGAGRVTGKGWWTGVFRVCSEGIPKSFRRSIMWHFETKSSIRTYLHSTYTDTMDK